jgi:hypothetical protein
MPASGGGTGERTGERTGGHSQGRTLSPTFVLDVLGMGER